MRHNEVICLGEKTVEEDDFGNEIETFDWRQVYANEYSISSQEHYAAAQLDLKPEKSFEIYSFEYNGEGKFKHEGVEYNIINTKGSGEKIVLVGEKDDD